MSAPQIRTLELESTACQWLDELSCSFPPSLAIGHEAEAFHWVETQLADTDTDSLADSLHATIDPKHRTKALRIVGLPLPRHIPPTPNRYEPPMRADVLKIDIPHMALASLTGHAFGNSLVRGGRIICDIFSREGYEDKIDSAFGSERSFDFHADGAVFPACMPDLLSLRCIRNRHTVPTILSSVGKDDFDIDTWTALHDPVYTIYYERTEATARHLSHTPLISDDQSGQQQLHYYGKKKIGFTEDATSKHAAALQDFQQALERNKVAIALDPGDVLIFNNRALVHGRSQFSDKKLPQSERRWLRRIFTATRPDLIAAIKQAPGRIITPAA